MSLAPTLVAKFLKMRRNHARAYLSGRVPDVSMAIVQSHDLETAGRDGRLRRHLIRQITRKTTFYRSLLHLRYIRSSKSTNRVLAVFLRRSLKWFVVNGHNGSL
jgi:hypothetical protein